MRRSKEATLFVSYQFSQQQSYAILALGGLHRWNAWWLYLAIYPATPLGNSSILGWIVTWTIDNQESLFRRTISFAMIQLVGQVAPGFAVRVTFLRPINHIIRKAMIICMFSMLTVAVLAVLLRFWLARKNAGRKETLNFRARKAVNTWTSKIRRHLNCSCFDLMAKNLVVSEGKQDYGRGHLVFSSFSTRTSVTESLQKAN